MTRRILPQTKRCIDALKAAGLERSEFSVRTPYSKKLGGYGKTEILCWAPTADRLAAIPRALQEGLNVDLAYSIKPDRTVWLHVRFSYAYRTPGKLHVYKVVLR